jgi:hypothetical protein
MNKKQLIVAWLIGITICATFLYYPKRYFVGLEGSQVFFEKFDKNNKLARLAMPVMQWGYVIPICLSILIIGGLLIYTLKDKKK